MGYPKPDKANASLDGPESSRNQLPPKNVEGHGRKATVMDSQAGEFDLLQESPLYHHVKNGKKN